MKILLLGSGGREHALAHKISQSPHCEQLFVAPGNGGMEAYADLVDMDPTDFDAVAAWVRETGIQMIVVGPEAPLVQGIWDHFRDTDVQIVGPSAQGAELEGSKFFAKEFMQRHHIPTAQFRSFTRETLDQGIDFLENLDPPVVLKADGLAAGKGVVICSESEEATKMLRSMITEGRFGQAGSRVVVEEFLRGMEFSVFALTDGKDYKLLPNAKDYKRIGEGDRGLNTGGMGAVSPVPSVDPVLMDLVEEKVVGPTIRGLAEDGIPYKGFLYFGLMLVDGLPCVIEYNCRMGDPETQVVIPRLQNDLVELFLSLDRGDLAAQEIEIDPRPAATVVLASGGYPEKYEKGKVIDLPQAEAHSMIYHAGTTLHDGQLVTHGGRVLAVTSLGDSLQAALKKCYRVADRVRFEGKYYRRDIGYEWVPAAQE